MIKVLKFGGSSLKSNETIIHVINHIKNELEIHKKLVVIVSAMGRPPDSYSTDMLKSLVNYTSNQELDLLLSCGEIISGCVLSGHLKEHDINSIMLNSYEIGITTTSDFNDANVLDVNVDNILKYLDEYDVVVVPGFQGITKDQRITTLGRGGSDFTAVILGHKLESDCVDIFSDVEGVMTANPKEVNGAKLIRELSYNELISLSYQGAKVIHHKACEYAYFNNVNLRFRSTFKDNVGTMVFSNDRTESFFSFCRSNDDVLIEIFPSKDIESIKRIYQVISNHKIKLYFLRVTFSSISMLVDKSESRDFLRTLKSEGIKYNYQKDKARISIVSNTLENAHELISNIISILSKSDISIIHLNKAPDVIQLVVDSKNVTTALNLLHSEISE